jgi:putative nucleotidyltransferase with HDIG domain
VTAAGAPEKPRAELAKAIPRRPRVSWWLGLVLALVFAVVVTPEITAERIFVGLGAGHVHEGYEARMTVRVPPFAGYETPNGRIGGLPARDPDVGCKLCGGVVITRGEVASAAQADAVDKLGGEVPAGPVPYLAYFLLAAVLAGLFAHHLRRSSYGRLVRVQLVSLALVLATAAIVKTVMLATAVSILIVPVALFAMLPTLALDRVVGLATGTLAALVVSVLVPCDVSVIVLLLVQAGTAGLMIAERPKSPWRAALVAGGVATLFTALTYPLIVYLRTWELPFAELRDPLHSPWVATVLGPAIATGLAVPLLPIYQLLVGEITHGKLVQLEDLSHPMLRQIAEKAPGTWQHSLMMANMAELAANAIGANGRLVRVGAYFHDLGKSLQPKYFIENLEPGETSPHDHLSPGASCDAIFSHVTEGIVTARRSGLHERIVDFMHMHHGNGVLEYFWAKARDQNDPRLTVDDFRYPGHPPQSRETAILAICDAVEAASRTLKKPDEHAIENLVQRIVYGKMHLGQLDESGLSAGDLRRIADSLRETIKHANHGRIEYPWQKAQQDASAGAAGAAAMDALTSTPPRLDSLDRPAKAEPVRAAPAKREGRESQHDTNGPVTPKLRVGANQLQDSGIRIGIEQTAPATRPEPVKESPKTVVGRAPAPAPEPEPDAGAAIALEAAKVAAAAAAVSASSPADTVPRKAPPPPPKPGPSEREQFAQEAKKTLDEVGKEAAAIAAAQVDTPSAVRKRAATIPPIKSVLVPPPKTTLAGPLLPKPPAKLADEDAATTQPRMLPATEDDDDAPSSRDDTQPRIQFPLPPPGSSLADRIDAQLDEGFGTDTPVSAPTRAELQALLNTAPDPTRVQSLEEIDRLKNLAEARRSGEMDATRRAPHPTAEVEEGDIEAAIELAPPARRSSTVGVAKKKEK